MKGSPGNRYAVMVDLEHNPQPDAISRASIFGVERVENQRTRRKTLNSGHILFEEVIGVKEEPNASLTPTLAFFITRRFLVLPRLTCRLLNQAKHALAGVT